MKLKIMTLVPACLAVLTLFAGPALAQEEQPAADPEALTHRLPPPRADGSATPYHASQSTGKTQEQLKREAAGSDHTSDCTYTFTSGTSATYLQFCVTVNGNITEFESPLNVEQIRQGSDGEGYGICDLNTGVGYYDYADEGDSGNWQAPATVAHSATMVKIERTTTDGLWTLTQTITSVPGTDPYARVLMALKNNSSESKIPWLFRWADVDPGQAADTDGDFEEDFGGTFHAAWGYGETAPYGLMFQNVGNPTPASAVITRTGGAVNNAAAIAPCDAIEGLSASLINVDGSILYLWQLQLNKNQSVSVTGRYMPF